jgi:hypothetical protein
MSKENHEIYSESGELRFAKTDECFVMSQIGSCDYLETNNKEELLKFLKDVIYELEK